MMGLRSSRGSLADVRRRLEAASADLAEAEAAVQAAAGAHAELAEEAADASDYIRRRSEVAKAEAEAIARRDALADRVAQLTRRAAEQARVEGEEQLAAERQKLTGLASERAGLEARLAELAVEGNEIEVRIQELEEEAVRVAGEFDDDVRRRQATLDAQRRERICWIAKQPQSRWASFLKDEPALVRRMVEAERERLEEEHVRRRGEIAEQARRSREAARLLDEGSHDGSIRPGQPFERVRVA
jgi:hypothetical protein